MDIELICSFFALLSKQSETEYFPLIQLAISEVERNLTPNSDKSDPRLCYLCGAIANMRFAEIDSAREKQILTPSGGVGVQGKISDRNVTARNIVAEYRALCADLIYDNSFVFFGTKG